MNYRGRAGAPGAFGADDFLWWVRRSQVMWLVWPCAVVRSSVVACTRARAENVGETTRRGSS